MSHDKQHGLGSSSDHSSSTLANFNSLISDSIIDSMRQYPADSLDIPNNSDWAVNAFATPAKDTNNAALGVRLFDQTTEEGVGLEFESPSGATNLIVGLRSRPETSAASNLKVYPKIYVRELPDNAAVESWSAGTAMTALDMAASNEYWQYDVQTIALSTLGLVAGRLTQMELTRVTGTSNLVGDWVLKMIKIGFS